MIKIDFTPIQVKEIYKGYFNNDEEGVGGYDGKLDIRPKYQREFIYDDEDMRNVIYTIMMDCPLNTMYWALADDGNYEVLDGQQRTLSILKYIAGDFYVDRSKYTGTGGNSETVFFENMTETEKKKILEYPLSIYTCSGKWEDKLMWFKRINIAGKTLSDQEIRNAVHNGPFINDAKRYLSKNNGAGYNIGKDYLAGEFNRQAFLETALKWISDRDNTNIDVYMANHQNDKDASELWEYFNEVIEWILEVFTDYRAYMKGLPWGIWYNKYHTKKFDKDDIKKRVDDLMSDVEVQSHKGIYEYILTGDIKTLNLRQFDEDVKRATYEKQKGNCAICKKHFEYNEMHGDHKKAWSKGGKTTPDNCQMLCTKCNLEKSADDSGY